MKTHGLVLEIIKKFDLMEMPTVFIDIETAPMRSSFDKLDDRHRDLWEKKVHSRNWPEEFPENTWKNAGLYPEFGRVVCVTLGAVANGRFVMKSFVGRDEEKILKNVALTKSNVFCGHNIKSFDIPFLCKRFIINKLPLPSSLQLWGKKPWEINHIDTMEMWKFCGKDYTSLDVLSMSLGIPSPKDAMDGSQVGEAFYGEKFQEIATYCGKDVHVTAKCYFTMKGEPCPETATNEILVCS